MNTKKQKSKLKKSAKGFFKTVGAIGGKATKKKLGKEHFRRIARLSHEARARNREAKEKTTRSGE